MQHQRRAQLRVAVLALVDLDVAGRLDRAQHFE
jgi:hypothetical protein